jgi:hypothetical protein
MAVVRYQKVAWYKRLQLITAAQWLPLRGVRMRLPAASLAHRRRTLRPSAPLLRERRERGMHHAAISFNVPSISAASMSLSRRSGNPVAM